MKGVQSAMVPEGRDGGLAVTTEALSLLWKQIKGEDAGASEWLGKHISEKGIWK